MTQTDMMEKDTVLVLDHDDNVIGSESKKGSHIFEAKTPRGILHRAFSVFLFDESTGELLLQQRASTKITFPNVSPLTVDFFIVSGLFWYPLFGLANNDAILLFFSASLGLDQYLLLASLAWYGTSRS